MGSPKGIKYDGIMKQVLWEPTFHSFHFFFEHFILCGTRVKANKLLLAVYDHLFPSSFSYIYMYIIFFA